MSRRHDALIPLSHDHHHTLTLARRAAIAARAGDAMQMREVAELLLRAYRADILQHFHDEEELVFPLLVGDGPAPPELVQALLEHVEVHARMRALQSELDYGEVAAGTLAALAELLQRHVRLEEKVLFPLVEQRAADRLQTVQVPPRPDRVTAGR